jgi:hypothetical protein
MVDDPMKDEEALLAIAWNLANINFANLRRREIRIGEYLMHAGYLTIETCNGETEYRTLNLSWQGERMNPQEVLEAIAKILQRQEIVELTDAEYEICELLTDVGIMNYEWTEEANQGWYCCVVDDDNEQD